VNVTFCHNVLSQDQELVQPRTNWQEVIVVQQNDVTAARLKAPKCRARDVGVVRGALTHCASTGFDFSIYCGSATRLGVAVKQEHNKMVCSVVPAACPHLQFWLTECRLYSCDVRNSTALR